MAKRARMKGVDVYVVSWKACGASGWTFFDKRRTADLYAKDERKKADLAVGKGVYKAKKWVCRIPLHIHNAVDTNETIEFIQRNYPHCVGED